MRTTIEMAREAGLRDCTCNGTKGCLERFASLVRADEREQRTWVGLTHEEIDYQAKKDDHAVYFALGALWAEAKLKEKNT